MTEPTASESMMAKIRALLANAEDAATTPEAAETYMAKATELLAKYGIDRALLAAKDPSTDQVGDLVIRVPAPYALDKVMILAGVATQLRCRTVRKTVPGGYALHLFGMQSDLERVELLYTSLLVQAQTGLARAYVPWGENAAAYRRSWLQGFATAICVRLRDIEQRTTADAAATSTSAGGPSVALVLADRSKLVDSRVKTEYPRLVSAPSRSLQGSGKQNGYAAGQRADLGGTRVGSGSGRRAIG